jgi:6-phosphofructokinase 1
MATSPIAKLALVVGGGPAPGINGVISAVTLQSLNYGIQVFGIMDGFKHLIHAKTDLIRRLTKDDVRYMDLRGGSMLRTSRTNPTKSEVDMQNVLKVFRELEIDALVTIGGDDTAYSASQVYRQSGGKVRVAHVPKTIDNDLPLPGSTPTFGFETARQLGTRIVRNLAEDARTTSRWYLIVSMGRAAGHLALGIGKSSAATLTIIPEEFRGREVKIDEICDIILGSMIKREAEGIRYGVVVLAEGLIGAIGEKALVAAMESGQLGRYGRVVRDPHNHLRLGEIEFGRMIRDALADRQEPLGLKTAFIDKDLGYELRCADPNPFDCEYTRDLGYGAVKFLRSEASASFGAIISYVEGHMEPLAFDTMINPETNRMKTRSVDIRGEGYECARRYMIRLEKHDFESTDAITKMAGVVNMTPGQFRERFQYLVQ